MRLATAVLVAVGLAAPGSHAFELCDSAAQTAEFHEALVSKVDPAFQQKRFAELDGLLNGLLEGHRLGRIDDARLKRAFQGFETQDAGFEPMILEWIRQQPKSPAAYLALGYHYMARGLALAAPNRDGVAKAQAAAAARELVHALKAFDVSDRLGARPTLSNAARVRIGLAAGLPGKLDATAVYRKTIRLYPDALEVRIQHLKGPGATTAATLERIDSTIADAGKMGESDRRYLRYLGLQQKGLVHAAAGETKRAAQAYESSYPLCPGLPRSIRLAIDAYDKLGDGPGLERTTDAFLQRDGRNCWALTLRAKARRQNGRLAEAFADYSRGVELACGPAFDGLAWFYENGRFVPRDLRKAAELYGIAAAHGMAGARQKAESLRAGAAR